MPTKQFTTAPVYSLKILFVVNYFDQRVLLKKYKIIPFKLKTNIAFTSNIHLFFFSEFLGGWGGGGGGGHGGGGGVSTIKVVSRNHEKEILKTISHKQWHRTTEAHLWCN